MARRIEYVESNIESKMSLMDLHSVILIPPDKERSASQYAWRLRKEKKSKNWRVQTCEEKKITLVIRIA